MFQNVNNAKYLISLIDEKTHKLKEMIEMWETGDPCEQASSDPNLQFELDSEIDQLWEDLHNLTSNVVR